MHVFGGSGCCTAHTAQSRSVSAWAGVGGWGAGAIQYQPGIRWQRTIKTPSEYQVAATALNFYSSSACGCWDGVATLSGERRFAEDGPVKAGLLAPAAPVAELEMSQDSFQSSTHPGEVRISPTLKVRQAPSEGSLTSHTRAARQKDL